jgi:hypothetical protein
MYNVLLNACTPQEATIEEIANIYFLNRPKLLLCLLQEEP